MLIVPHDSSNLHAVFFPQVECEILVYFFSTFHVKCLLYDSYEPPILFVTFFDPTGSISCMRSNLKIDLYSRRSDSSVSCMFLYHWLIIICLSTFPNWLIRFSPFPSWHWLIRFLPFRFFIPLKLVNSFPSPSHDFPGETGLA